MRTFRRFSFSLRSVLLTLVLFAVPLSASAAFVGGLNTPDNKTVTRGEFVRAAIKVLELPVLQECEGLPYLRVPRGLMKEVCTAHDKDALLVFGRNDIVLGRTITRGQAAGVLAALAGLHSQSEVDFKDVRESATTTPGVKVAIDQGWMEPLRDKYFGVRRVLTGKDARLLLRKVRGDAGIIDPDTGDGVQELETPTIKIRVKTKERLGNLPNYQILETIWRLVTEEYLYEDKIDLEEAFYKAAEGLVKSLEDRHTQFFRPVESRGFTTRIQGNFEGIGAQVEDQEGVLTIVTPLRGSPAEAAGLKPGDQVLAVDGKSIDGVPFLEAVDMIRGPKGSTVHLSIRRNGIDLQIPVIRGTITVSELIVDWHGDVAALTLTQFGSQTLSEVRAKVLEIQQKDPKGFILDLRNNPGGLLTAAVEVTGQFVPPGSDVLKVVGRDETGVKTTRGNPSLHPDVPMVVLINGGSASAAEIVAAALQDHDRAIILGEKTFGKGSVQQVMQFSDQSLLKMTTAEYFSPNGHKVDGVGVTPDIPLANQDQRDDQMNRALDLLR